MWREVNVVVVFQEGSWENAFCLYLKYESLFFHNIRDHPDYSKVPVQVKSINAANFRVIKPKAEHAKRELLKLYKRDYLAYKEEIKNDGTRRETSLESTVSKLPTSSNQTPNSFKSQASFNTSRRQMRKREELNGLKEENAESKTSSLRSKRTSLEEAKVKSRKTSESSKTTQKSVASSI